MVEFNPGSWRKAGGVVEDAGTSFASSMQSTLGGLQNTGADGGISMIDGLIAGVLPAVMEAVGSTVTGIAQGLAAEGAALVATGNAYAEVEAAAEEIGNFMEGEY